MKLSLIKYAPIARSKYFTLKTKKIHKIHLSLLDNILFIVYSYKRYLMPCFSIKSKKKSNHNYKFFCNTVSV